MSFIMLALGDSVMWGQGLLEGDKFYTLVKNEVAGIAQTNVDLRIYAHSGATIKRQEQDASGTSLWGEVPSRYPSILAQLDKAKRDVSAADVRLVLVDGGINDVTVDEIVAPNLNPWFDKEAWIRERTRQAIWGANQTEKPMEDLLKGTLGAFPNAFIVVSGYYQIVSQNSALTAVANILAPFSLLVTDFAMRTIILHSEAFQQESTRSLQGAVTAANAHRGETRVFFADPYFGPWHALGANEGRLWTGSDDPLHKNRLDWYQANWQKTNIANPVTPLASMGHPNVAGARMYKTAIMGQVQSFAHKIGPPRPQNECDQICRSIEEKRYTIQGLNEAKVGLNPRNAADRQEIAQINAEINSLQQEITTLQQRAQTLSCPPM